MPASNIKITPPPAAKVWNEKKVAMYFKVPEGTANMLKLIALIENKTLGEILFTKKLEAGTDGTTGFL